MCGINGILGLADTAIATQKINAMNRCMQHRGPDDEGIFVEDKIALGHRRLSIIDLSTAGHQPMASYDGRYQIIYNGELYNFKELKFELQRVTSGSSDNPYFFKTNSDTEVILAAYIRWGTACLNYFNGMFAFAIWDTQTNELIIARDRLGIKPLYYFFTSEVFAFSSEVRSLLATELIPKKIDSVNLIDYLRYQTVHAPNTIIKGIKMLMPGNYIKIVNNTPSIYTYWDINKKINESASQDKSYEAICKDVNELLSKAVEKRLVADVPFGAFLSGGIDSSAIVGLMSKVSTEKIKTFTITFDESEFSEAQYAKLIAKKFDTDHHEIILKPIDFLEQLPLALKAMDHPSGDGPNTYIVSKATKAANITMALSGLGGDELFAGYDIFKRTLDLNNKRWLNNIPLFIRKFVGTSLQFLKPSIATDKMAALLKLNEIDFNTFYPLSRQLLMDVQLLSIINIKQLPANSISQILTSHSTKRNNQLLTASNYQITNTSIAEITTYMQNVLLRDTDQMSMAHALELRVPFMDHQLVEYVLGVPDRYKSTLSPKKLLVDAMGDLLPSEIVNRPKMGFTFPWKSWMQNELKLFCEQKIIALSKRDYFKKQGVLDLWNQFLKNDVRINWSKIWILVVLENWMQENGVD
ncbi:MAG: asparagine synthase (glutamine-hydrolyzing) [Bacteroidia bacterium]